MRGPRRLTLGIVAAALTAAACSIDDGASAPIDCASLKGFAPSGVRIEVAEAITPDPTWPYPPDPFGAPAGPGAGVTGPFCRLAGVIDAETGFEVWLPEDWNGRIQNVGNGGYAGSFDYRAADAALEQGYATATTDAGHKGAVFDASWAVGRRDRLESFAHLAHHRLAEVSKALVAARYGRPADYAYFTSCSTGGRLGLASAQLHPEDYDGVVAGAPVLDIVRLETTALWFAEHVGDPLPPPLLTLIADAAVAHCDPKDGVTDGIVSAPQSCDFDPGRLACGLGAADQCLTPEQVRVARAMHGRRATAAGLSLYPGRAWGTRFTGEAGPPTVMSETLIALADTDYEWSTESFDFDRDVPPLEAELAALVGMNPDLRAFADAGGKLIVWHGWNDPIINPYTTIDYVTSVEAEMGDVAVRDFARLYLAPGVAHCAGGAGPDRFDALAALRGWVEEGKAPERLIASKLGPDGRPTMTRPLCPYPQIAVYDGDGDPNDATSFSCQEL